MCTQQLAAQAFFDRVLSNETRELLAAGVSEGMRIYRSLNAQSRLMLGVYASNSETRDIFSSLCSGLAHKIDSENNGVSQCAQVKTSSHYIEIKGPNFIMHVRNKATTEVPSYVLCKCALNRTFDCVNEQEQRYCQLAYEAANGGIITKCYISIPDEKGKEIAYLPIALEKKAIA